MSILEITFSISFICNDLDLTDILSKTETLWVRQFTSPKYGNLKLEDLKVLRRSPDLIYNVKIGQG